MSQNGCSIATYMGGPRDPSLALRLKVPFVQGTVGEWHTAFHAASVPTKRVPASLLL